MSFWIMDVGVGVVTQVPIVLVSRKSDLMMLHNVVYFDSTIKRLFKSDHVFIGGMSDDITSPLV